MPYPSPASPRPPQSAWLLVGGALFMLGSPEQTGVGGPSVSPSLTPIPSPSLLPATGALEPGTYYRLTDVGDAARGISGDRPVGVARFTFTVPEGWATAEGGSFVYREVAAAAPQSLRWTWRGPTRLPGPSAMPTPTPAITKTTLVDAGTTIDELASLPAGAEGPGRVGRHRRHPGGLPGQSHRVDRPGRPRCHEMRRGNHQVLAKSQARMSPAACAALTSVRPMSSMSSMSPAIASPSLPGIRRAVCRGGRPNSRPSSLPS